MPEHNKIRVVARNGARELTEQELTAIQGASSLPCKITSATSPAAVLMKTRSALARHKAY